MKSFLTALMQATIYEKKADKVENLARFGLLPLGNEDSRAIVIELGEANGQIIEKFEVGDYNIELGRGAMGAFVRRPDKFEIWMAIVELIDLDLDYHKWVFANMWNLQFGRFMPERDDKNVEKAINLAKLLLNTQMEEEKENILHRKPDFVIKTKGEFFDGVNIEVFEEKDRALVSFKFLGNIKNEILKSFVGKTKGKFFAISKQDAERLKDANK